MYLASLAKERFTVAIVNCKREGCEGSDALMQEIEGVSWEIARALNNE